MGEESLGARLRAKREERGLTLQEIAERVGVAKSTIQRYENDAIETPKMPVITAIAATLGVSAQWLLGNTDDEQDGLGEDLDFKYALYEEAAPLTAENRAKLLELARFFKAQQERDADGKK